MNAGNLNSSDLYDAFVAAKLASGRAPATIDSYHWRVKPFVDEYPLLPVDAETVEKYMKEHQGGSDETAATVYRKIRAFYSWLVKRRYITAVQDPFKQLETPKIKRKVPRILTVEQMRKAVAASKPGIERRLILTLVDTGARIGDLVGLSKADVVGNSLRLGGVTGGGGKTGGRMVPISAVARAYLESCETLFLFPKHMKFGNAHVTPIVDEPMGVQSMRQAVVHVLKRAGFKGPKLGPHMLRHSFGTAYIDSGGDVISLSRIMGHTTTRMTERYVSLSTESLRAKHGKHSPFNSMLTMEPATPSTDLELVTLQLEVINQPLLKDGGLVQMHVSADRRSNHVYYSVKATGGGRLPTWRVASLGPDLPVSTLDAFRLAIAKENDRRRKLVLTKAPV